MRIFFIILFYLITIPSIAQQAVFKIYHDLPDTNNYSTSSVFESNNKFHFFALWSGNFNSSAGIDYFKVNSRGKEEARRFYIDTTIEGKISNFSITFKDKIYSVGASVNKNNIDRPQFEIYDTTGALLFDTIYNISHYGRFTGIFHDYKPGYFMVVYNYCKTDTNKCDSAGFKIVRIDSIGGIHGIYDLSEEGPGIFEWGSEVLLTKEGNYMVSGSNNKYETNKQKSDVFIINCDTVGKINWRKYYGKKDDDEDLIGGRNYFKRINDSLIVLVTYTTTNTGSVQPFIKLINGSGSEVKDLEYIVRNIGLIPWGGRADGVAVTLKEELVLACLAASKSKYKTPPNDDLQIPVLVKSDLMGNIKWRRFHPFVNEDASLFAYPNLIKTSDEGFLYTATSWGRFPPAINSTAYMMAVKTDSCGFTQGDTCRLRYSIDQLQYNHLKMSLIPSLSNYCHVRWTVGDSMYITPTFNHTFAKKGIYKIKVWGFAGDGLDSSEIYVTVDSIQKIDTRTAIIDISKSSHFLNVYPIPAHDYIEVDWKISLSRGSLTLFGIDGKNYWDELLEPNTSNRKIYIESLPKGIYQLILKEENIEIERMRIIIQ